MNIKHYLFKKEWEKLIKHLEKYLLELAKKNPLYTNLNVNLPWVSILWVHETILISEKFWFIKWLVENNKIDFYTTLRDNWHFRHDFYAIYDKKEYERLIMLLSVSKTPIEDLVSYLM